ncbi:hypothetical protein CC80DRAFT_542401 [Byssothecium circinans]|uniref:Protein kinase domain-containing protein n=1 Tax=Byssothecium circinans TaxID=147558 RepID=A0A6A5ULX3_9PLEO|nr:hypothetical protein CC80DRAFT_542401 [Byssothecium circinans]
MIEKLLFSARHSNANSIHALTNKTYLPIKLAGTGTAADVWYCAKTTDIAQKHPLPSIPANLPTDFTAFPTIYAVKIPRRGKHYTLSTEISTLTRIATALDTSPLSKISPLRQNVPALHARGTRQEDGDFRWLTTSAVIGPCLGNFIPRINCGPKIPLPRTLVLSIALQLSQVISFLHGLEPPIVHNDVFELNVMLDTENLTAQGFPTVVLIDFGTALEGNKAERKAAWERLCFFKLIGKLIRVTAGPGTGVGEDAEENVEMWEDFIVFVESVKVMDDARSFEEFWRRFGAWIEEVLEGIAWEERKTVGCLVRYG